MQTTISCWQIILTFVPSLLILAGVTLAKVFFNVPISLLMRDPAAISGQSPLSGLISNLGSIGWFLSATICIFTTAALYGYSSKNIFYFFLFSGFLSIYLGLDDFFMFHDTLAPKYLGIKENYILFSIAICVLAYLAKFWKLILSMEYEFLVIALIFLFTSICIDVLLESLFTGYEDWVLLCEDGFKFLGIVSWFSYFAGTSYQLIRSRFAS
jgi:hypothetical protein